MLSGLAEWARDIVLSAGYGGLIVAMVVENLFPPIPSEIVLPLGGYEVAQGNLNFAATVAAATAGSLIGALILYAIGRYGGRPVVLRWGKVLRVSPRELERAEGWFGRFGDRVVLGARVIPLARSIVSIPAGMMRMPLLRFCVLTTIGSLVWNLILVGAGYQLGANWEQVSSWVGRFSDVIGLLVVFALVTGLFWLLRRRRSTA